MTIKSRKILSDGCDSLSCIRKGHECAAICIDFSDGLILAWEGRSIPGVVILTDLGTGDSVLEDTETVV